VINFIKIFLLALILQVTLCARDININKFLDNANKTNKHLLVWLHKNGCGYCDNMQEFTLNEDDIKSLIEKEFIYIHMNISEKDKVTYKDFVGSAREFANHLGFDFYPTSLFFSSNGELIYDAMGFHDEVLFLKILKFIHSRSYEKMDYDSYENEYEYNNDD